MLGAVLVDDYASIMGKMYVTGDVDKFQLLRKIQYNIFALFVTLITKTLQVLNFGQTIIIIIIIIFPDSERKNLITGDYELTLSLQATVPIVLCKIKT